MKIDCDRCSEGYPAVMWCADCRKTYCDTCKSIHETWSEFELHNTVTIQKYLDRPNEMLESREVSEACKIHTQMKLDMYCETCNQLICDDCIDDHYKHHYDFVDNVMETVGKELKQILSSLAKCLKEVRNTVAVIEDHEQQIDGVDKPITERIHNLYSEMFKMLRQQKEKRIEDIRKSFKVSLMASKEKAKHIESQLMNCLNYSSNAVNDRQLLLHNKWIISNVDKVLKQGQHIIDLQYEQNELLETFASRPTVVSHFSLLTDNDFLLLPTHIPECFLNAVRIGYSVKLMVTLSDKYNLPVIDQSRHLQIHCNKENIIQNVQIEEQSDGLYYMWYIPKRKEDHSVSIYWRNLPLISKEVELLGDFIRDINIIDKYGPSTCSKLLQMPYLLSKGFKDKVVVNDGSTNQLIVYDQNFNFLHVIGLDESFKGIAGIALHKECLFVADQHQNLVVKLELDGNFISCFGSLGTSKGQFRSPHGLVFSQSEYLFVCDRYNHRIQVFRNEKFVYCFGKHGSEPGAFNQPVDLTLNNSESQLFITDNCNNRVQVFSLQGKFLSVFGDSLSAPITLQHPVGIFYTPENYLLVSSYGTDSVLIFKEDGSLHSSVKDTQKFNSPCGVVMINRQIVIASHLKNRLIIF
ncbi:E3 ubiquitin-protein ligase TRIM71-like [Dysidea avara]|uniref:E3 ubiquitin-protein ligase TRIM71-like n=1 Tax=Dysidea avara TaxID=196820 RepID=UPI00333121D7